MNTLAEDTFPRIWRALTVEALAQILSAHRPKVRNRVVSFDCPQCGKPEAYVYSPKDGKGPALHCNRKNNCGFGRPVFDYVKEQEGGDGGRALAALMQITGISPVFPPATRGRVGSRAAVIVPPVVRIGAAPIPPGMDGRQEAYQDALPASSAYAYVRRRGLTLAEALTMGFGYAADGLLRGRLTYPIRNRAGQTVAFEGRALTDRGPKCLCDGDKSEGVFLPGGAFDAADLVLCEGPFDAAALHLMGYNAVATLGTANLPTWLLRSCAYESVQIAFDSDPAGDGAVQKRVIDLTHNGAAVGELRPPAGTDWGDALQSGRDVLRAALLNALFSASGRPESVLVPSGRKETRSGAPQRLTEAEDDAAPTGFNAKLGVVNARESVGFCKISKPLAAALRAVFAAVDAGASVAVLTSAVRAFVTVCDLADALPLLRLHLESACRMTPGINALLDRRGPSLPVGDPSLYTFNT